jgi:coenzyme Q-binding protein COQ10
MTVYAESRILIAPRDRIFDLVADVESYPEFLPLWRDARIYQRSGNVYRTEQAVGLGRLEERFHTTTVLSRPWRIEVTSEDPLFREFYIHWDFANIGLGCRISVAMQWWLASRMLQEAIDRLLPSAARSIVAAFERRAREELGA